MLCSEFCCNILVNYCEKPFCSMHAQTFVNWFVRAEILDSSSYTHLIYLSCEHKILPFMISIAIQEPCIQLWGLQFKIQGQLFCLLEHGEPFGLVCFHIEPKSIRMDSKSESPSVSYTHLDVDLIDGPLEQWAILENREHGKHVYCSSNLDIAVMGVRKLFFKWT